ncbi:MAG: nucleotidyltransferase family protein [Bryobacterales bacterium]|nr:nucleotidyltransferase family protein [Bryobacterales bacterium]
MRYHDVVVDTVALRQFCERNQVRKLSLFGSILTDRFTPQSDVDILVEFEPEATPTLLDMVRMEAELGTLLHRKVDLRTPQDLSQYFRRRVQEMAQPQYERV